MWLQPSSAVAETTLTIKYKQSQFDITRETGRKLINPSGDRTDAFRALKVTQVSGIPITIPVNGSGDGEYEEAAGSRVLPVSFDCDYSNGVTRGVAQLSYRDPRNLNRQISGRIEVECLPLTAEEQAEQIATKEAWEQEANRIRAAEELKRRTRVEAEEAKRQARLDAERESREAEAREEARRNSPEYKRAAAEQHIKRMRAEIAAAKSRIGEERRIGQVSGYVDSRKLHELGSLIVAAEREIERSWLIYKSNGGTLRSLDAIR